MEVKVTVKTGVRKEMMRVVNDVTFTIAIKEPASENRANARVRELLAEYFEVEVGNVRLIAGHHVPRKTFTVTGV